MAEMSETIRCLAISDTNHLKNNKMTNKDIDYKEEHQNIRKKLWMDVYVAYVGAANSTYKEGAANWADTALEKFDARFKEPQLTEDTKSE